MVETRQSMEFPCPINNQSVTMVDMAGFDKSNVPETARTTGWLRQEYTVTRKFTATISLPRITDNGVVGLPVRNLLMPRNLCGKDFLSDTMLVPTTGILHHRHGIQTMTMSR